MLRTELSTGKRNSPQGPQTSEHHSIPQRNIQAGRLWTGQTSQRILGYFNGPDWDSGLRGS